MSENRDLQREEIDIGNPDVMVDHQRGNLDCWEGNVLARLREPEPAYDPGDADWLEWSTYQERGRLELRTIGALRLLWDRAERAEAARDALSTALTKLGAGIQRAIDINGDSQDEALDAEHVATLFGDLLFDVNAALGEKR